MPPNPTKLTQSHRDCLATIHEAGSAVLQNHGRILAAGEFIPFAPETILRMIGLHLIEFTEPLRMRLTQTGIAAIGNGKPHVKEETDAD